MKHFIYKDGFLTADGHKLEDIAREYGTPAYIYSAPRIMENYTKMKNALTNGLKDQKHMICYAVKANSHLAILKMLAKQGCGADVVSGGELKRCIKAGIDPKKIVFSGVGKTEKEIRLCLETGILQINAESLPELERISEIAVDMGIKAPVGLRINPDVAGGEHDKTSTGRKDDKFGISYDHGIDAYRMAKNLPGLNVIGMSVHIGSQIVDPAPFERAYVKIAQFVSDLKEAGITLKTIDLGGGMGITYTDETPLDMDAYAQIVHKAMGGFDATLIFEPGRAFTGDAGVLLARVEYLKVTPSGRKFVILDTGMGELMRPALYGVQHPVMACREQSTDTHPVEIYDVVGPICESSDIFDRNISGQIMQPGDYVAIMVSGAYGMSMASQYNTRPLPLEIMVDQDNITVISPRRSLDDLIANESIPGWI